MNVGLVLWGEPAILLAVSPPLRGIVLVSGCVLLGLGVAMLLAADLGSDGYSTLINGLARALSVPFWAVNVLVGLVLLALAASRGVRPGVGTVVQVAVAGPTVSAMLPLLDELSSGSLRVPMLVLAFPVLAVGTAGYLGAHLGAGPVEAAALAWDPPVPFRWSYNAVQGGWGGRRLAPGRHHRPRHARSDPAAGTMHRLGQPSTAARPSPSTTSAARPG